MLLPWATRGLYSGGDTTIKTKAREENKMKNKIRHTDRQVWEAEVEANSPTEALEKFDEVPGNERKIITDDYDTEII